LASSRSLEEAIRLAAKMAAGKQGTGNSRGQGAGSRE
jgi:hypothetical protein